MDKPYIVCHTSPDWDCIGAVWLLQRYGGMVDNEVVFVNTGNPDPDVLARAAAVVDTGRELDPLRLRFDHHQLPGAEANTCCAASLVFQWLRSERDDIEPIGPLIDLIYAGDTGQANYGATWSRVIGIHALLSAQKSKKADDATLLTYGFAILDDLATALTAHHEARAALEAHTVYRSDDGLVVALKDAPPHATSAAHEAGARLVLFQSSSEETNAIGIMRAGEQQEPHCGRLVRAILDYAPHIRMANTVATTTMAAQALFAELRTWYLHEAGFFAGRGTAKAPDPRPIECNLADIARAINAAWKR